MYRHRSYRSTQDTERRTVNMLVKKFGITAEQALAAIRLVQSRQFDNADVCGLTRHDLADLGVLDPHDVAALDHVCAIFLNR
jgi:hypothetical protein